MKRLGLLIAIFTGVTFASFAQNTNGPRGHKGGPREMKKSPEERAQKMKEELNLSEAQYQKVLALNKSIANERKQQKVALKEKYRNELSTILTKDQVEKLKSKKAEGKTPEEMAIKRTNKMKEHLGLTDDQYQKVLALNIMEAQEMKRRQDENHQNMKNKRDQYKSQLSTILTPEQMAKLDETRPEPNRMKDKSGRPNKGKGKPNR